MRVVEISIVCLASRGGWVVFTAPKAANAAVYEERQNCPDSVARHDRHAWLSVVAWRWLIAVNRGRLEVNAVVRCGADSVHDNDSRCNFSRVVGSWCCDDAYVDVVVDWSCRLHTSTHTTANAQLMSVEQSANQTRNFIIGNIERRQKTAVWASNYYMIVP